MEQAGYRRTVLGRFGCRMTVLGSSLTVADVATGSACATELAMTEHGGTLAAVTTAAAIRVRVRMLGLCRQG
jgi:hypothetical protein